MSHVTAPVFLTGLILSHRLKISLFPLNPSRLASTVYCAWGCVGKGDRTGGGVGGSEGRESMPAARPAALLSSQPTPAAWPAPSLDLPCHLSHLNTHSAPLIPARWHSHSSHTVVCPCSVPPRPVPTRLSLIPTPSPKFPFPSASSRHSFCSANTQPPPFPLIPPHSSTSFRLALTPVFDVPMSAFHTVSDLHTSYLMFQR